MQGADYLLPVLFRSVCAITKIYAALIYIDDNDPFRIRIEQSKGMGLLNKLFGNAHGVAMAKFVNFSNEEKQSFYDNPVYFSGYLL